MTYVTYALLRSRTRRIFTANDNGGMGSNWVQMTILIWTRTWSGVEQIIPSVSPSKQISQSSSRSSTTAAQRGSGCGSTVPISSRIRSSKSHGLPNQGTTGAAST